MCGNEGMRGKWLSEGGWGVSLQLGCCCGENNSGTNDSVIV